MVFADFARERRDPGEPVEIPIDLDDAIGNEWAVIVDAPGYSACLLAWEHPREIGGFDLHRRFEAVWTVDPEVTRQAAGMAARLAARADAELGARLEALLADRPLAMERPAPALTSLTNRIVSYVERGLS